MATKTITFAQNSSTYSTLVKQASEEITRRDYNKAKETLAKVDTNKFKANELTKGIYYQQLARLAYYFSFEDHKAVDYYYKAIKIFEFNRSNEDIGIAYSNLLPILTDLREYKKAETAFQKSLPFVKNNDTRYGNLLINYSRLKFVLGDYDKAAQCNFTALKLYEKTNDRQKIGLASFQLGIVMEGSRQFEKALEFYQKAFDIRKELKDTLGMSNVLNNTGIIYKNRQEYQKAIHAYNQALKFATELKRPVLQINPLINMAVIETRLKNYQPAIELYERAWNLAIQFKRTNDIRIIESNLIQAYLNVEEYKKALPLAKRIHETDYEKASLEEKIALNNNLAEALNGVGKHDEAFPYMQKALNFKDSLYRRQGSEAIAEMATKYQTEKKEQKIRLLANEIDLQKLSLDNQALALDKKSLEIANRDYKFSLQRSSLEKERLKGNEQQQQIALLAKDKSIRELELRQKNFFLLISIVSTLLIIFFGYQFYKKRELKEKAALQNEKLRISQELHDNIGSQLTFINNSIQSFKMENGEAVRLNEAQQITTNTIRELRRTVWLINQPEFSLDEFVVKLREYVKPFETGKPLIKITSSGASDDCVLKPITATNLFRVIQEAVNNSLKYAEARNLHITFQQQKSVLDICIRDDGNGFNLSESRNGYGIKNIYSRVEVLKGNCQIETADKKGTEISITIPI